MHKFTITIATNLVIVIKLLENKKGKNWLTLMLQHFCKGSIVKNIDVFGVSARIQMVPISRIAGLSALISGTNRFTRRNSV